jgi:hypothetical protein
MVHWWGAGSTVAGYRAVFTTTNNGLKTADAVPVTTVLTDGVNQHPPVQHPLDGGCESVVDEPQVSYYQVQRWKPNRKLESNRKLFPVHFGNSTDTCFLTTYHPSFVVHW